MYIDCKLYSQRIIPFTCPSKFQFDMESFDSKFQFQFEVSNESSNFSTNFQNLSLIMSGTQKRSLGLYSAKLV